jgi:hypothetical protein
MENSRFDSYLTHDEQILIEKLDSPFRIQAFLDTLTYPSESFNRSPLRVMRDRRAHCLDGGLLAAMLMRRLGYPPLLVDILPEANLDDDHVLVVYRIAGCWGAVAKSNYVGLRYREPVYRSLRELVMSYFDVFFNVDGLRTLRSYTRPINLKKFDSLDWEVEDSAADRIEQYLKYSKSKPLLTAEQVAALTILDPVSQKAGLLIANPDGLYKPSKSRQG